MYHTIKHMDKKDVTPEFIKMRKKAKEEFFQMETEFETKYHTLKNGEVVGYR